MNALGGDRFDQWLGHQLQQHASAHSAPSPLPASARYHAAYIQGGLHVPVLAKLATLATTKAAIGLTVGVLAVGAAGEAVVTGSVNPANWGQQVVKQVNSCKLALTPGSHGIGECVSSFASQHGKKVSADHRATPTPGQGKNHTPGPPSGKGKPTPPSHAHPTPPAHGHKVVVGR
jgi:hypothetical protein